MTNRLLAAYAVIRCLEEISTIAMDMPDCMKEMFKAEYPQYQLQTNEWGGRHKTDLALTSYVFCHIA